MELFIYTLCQTLEKLGFMLKNYFFNLKYKLPTQELSKTEANHLYMNTQEILVKDWAKPQLLGKTLERENYH